MLKIDGVSKTFPPAAGLLRLLMRTASDTPVVALSDVSFSVAPGEVVGLVGPNGAGKSTLFRIVATLLEPSAGSVSVDGFDSATDPAEIRRRIGLVLEGARGVYGRLSGLDNLEFFGVMAGLDRAAARRRGAELLELFGLAGRDRRVFGYSSGMRVRLALARALMVDPPFLLLDEPTRSLDPKASGEVLGLVRELAAAGRAVLFATHRLDEVRAVCDRAVVLTGGRVRFDGDPTAVDLVAFMEDSR